MKNYISILCLSLLGFVAGCKKMAPCEDLQVMQSKIDSLQKVIDDQHQKANELLNNVQTEIDSIKKK